MKEEEFKALVSLLEDDDPQVAEHVWGKLTSMGIEGVQRLEAEWEVQHDPIIQEKLEDVIALILAKDSTQELLDWRKGGGSSLWEGWLMLTKFRYPTAELQAYKNQLSRLVNKTWLSLNNQMEPYEKFRIVNHILFTLEGYKSNKKDSHFPENNFLNFVFDQKKGNVITISLLYYLICKELDLPVSGVIVPGYFFIHYLDSHLEFYIDVYNGGLFYSRNDLQNFLKAINLTPNPSYFRPTSNIYILLYLIRNIARDYRRNDQPDKGKTFDQLLEDIDISF